MTNDEFLKSLSPAEWDEAEAIEAKLGELLGEGITEYLAIKFVRTVMAVREVRPTAAVWGIFSVAFSTGMDFIGNEGYLAGLAKELGTPPLKRKRKRKLKSTLK